MDNSKREFMKKIFVWAIVLVMSLSLMGCASEEEKKQALIQYMDYDTVEMDILYEEMLESFNSVVSGNQFNNAVTCKEFKDNTRDMAKETLREAKEVAEKIEDEELAEVHNLFVVYAESFAEFIDMAIEGIEDGSDSKINEVNARLAEINDMQVKYHDELKKLGKKRGMDITVTYK